IEIERLPEAPMSELSPVEAIYFAALHKPTQAARSAYLDEACAGDAELRGRVEKLLAAQPYVERFLDQPANAMTGAYQPPVADALGSPLEQIGDRIGPYKLLQNLG